MRLQSDGLVCGVRAVALRSLVKRERFGTVSAMHAFELDEPDVTAKLLELQQEGWLVYAGRIDDQDRWAVTDKGYRLSATKVLQRITVAQGLVILEQLVAEASAINAEPERSQRIVAMYLFGSLLTGSSDGTIGDVDIVVETKRRLLPASEREKLEEAEQAGENWGVSRWARGSVIIGSRLKKVARAVSIHDITDLRLPDVRYRLFYAFDLERECEVPFSTAEQMHPEPLRGDDTPADPIAEPFTRIFRPWPVMVDDDRTTMDSADCYKAQHLWQLGLSADAIGEQLRVTPADVTAYLASRMTPDVVPAKVEGLLSACVRRTLPAKSPFSISVIVKLGRSLDSVEVQAFQPGTFDLLGRIIRYSAHEARIYDAAPSTIKTMLAVSAVAFRWRTKMKTRIGKLYLDAHSFVTPDRPAAPQITGYVAFHPLEAPLLSALANLWASRAENVHRVGVSVDLRYADRSRIIKRHGGYCHWSEERVPKSLTAPINDALRPFRKRWSSFLDGSTSYTISVNQDMLDDDD